MIFVEISYTYTPIVKFGPITSETLSLTRAFTVRERLNNDMQTGTATSRICSGTHLSV